MTLDEMLAQGEAHARKVLLEGRKEALTAFYHLVSSEGENVIIPCPWRNAAEKEVILDVVKQVARQIDAVGVMFVGEAWMVEVKDPAKIGDMDPPSQQPGRIEIVSILATVGPEQGARALRMVRDKPGGRLVALKAQISAATGLGGRLIEGILP